MASDRMMRIASKGMSILLSVLMLTSITSCRKKEPEAIEVTRPVNLLKLEDPGKYRELAYPAKVKAFQEADLSFLVPGRLIEIKVRRGESVKKGQLLARLDPQDYMNKFEAAKARALERESFLKRIKLALSKKVATEMELEEAQRSHKVTLADKRIAAKAVDDTYLRAPFEGEIGMRYVDNFQDVQAKEAVLHLQDVSRLKIVIDVPENIRILARETEKTGEGKPAKSSNGAYVVFEDLPGQKYPLEYYEDEQTADPRTRTYAVTFVMDAPEKQLLLPGMSATVKGRLRIPSEKGQDTFYVPVTAVFSGPGQNRYVWVQNPETGRVQKQQVKVGSMAGDKIEILEGVSIGQTIAISGVHHLREGMKVKPLVYKARREEG